MNTIHSRVFMALGTGGGASLGAGAEDPPPNISAINCFVKSSALVAAPALSAFNLESQSDFYSKKSKVKIIF